MRVDLLKSPGMINDLLVLFFFFRSAYRRCLPGIHVERVVFGVADFDTPLLGMPPADRARKQFRTLFCHPIDLSRRRPCL